MISLIFTNHHDCRPLAKCSYGYIRPPIEFGKRKGKSTTGLGAYKFFNKESSSDSEEDIIFKQRNA